MGYWGYRQKPKHVKNGMKLQSDKVSKTWWSDRWLTTLGALDWSSRLYRGLDYARKGQVMDLDITPGNITARVQGTKPKPYSIHIELESFSVEAWGRVIEIMGSKASYIARLIMGEMPCNIEDAFKSAGVELFPVQNMRISMTCSCQDTIKPCKHIAAVFYVLAEEFDRNPFMIFQLRGCSKKEIMDRLAEIRKHKAGGSGEKEPAGEIEPEADAAVEKKGIDRFWNSGEKMKGFRVSLSKPRVEMALLKRLGPPVICDREKHFWSLMKRVYRVAGEEAGKSAFKDKEENVQ